MEHEWKSSDGNETHKVCNEIAYSECEYNKRYLLKSVFKIIQYSPSGVAMTAVFCFFLICIGFFLGFITSLIVLAMVLVISSFVIPYKELLKRLEGLKITFYEGKLSASQKDGKVFEISYENLYKIRKTKTGYLFLISNLSGYYVEFSDVKGNKTGLDRIFEKYYKKR